MAGIALSLFTDEEGQPIQGYEEAFNAFEILPQKRVHYKYPTYIKYYQNYESADGFIYDDFLTWGRMENLYTLISNQFPPEKMGIEEVVEIGMIRIWHNQDIKVREAEIKGSEGLGIEERLFLHESLLDFLEGGYRPEQLNGWLEELVNWCKQFSARTIVLALIIYGGTYDGKRNLEKY